MRLYLPKLELGKEDFFYKKLYCLIPKLQLGNAKHILIGVRTTYSIKGDDYAYFVTSTIVNWLPVFRYSQCTEFLIEALNYSKLRKGLKIYAWVIMPEHFHMICKSKNLVDIIYFNPKLMVNISKVVSSFLSLDTFHLTPTERSELTVR